MNSEFVDSRSTADSVDLGIIWDRLIAIADAQLLAMVRTSFSTLVREVRDIGCAILDARGRSIAFGTEAVPGFNSAAHHTLAHMLRAFPPESLHAGDVVATNDPWMGGGHRPDIAVMRPVFHRGRIVAYLVTYSHLPDIGGRGLVLDSTHILEEGFAMPMVKLFRAGRRNDELFELIRANVRIPDQVVGDIMANVSGGAVGAQLLGELLEDYGLDDLQAVADGIILSTEQAMRRCIRSIPDGTYVKELVGEAIGDDIFFRCMVTVAGDSIHVDFTGTGAAVPYAINVTEGDMRSFVGTAIKCITTPELPCNQGDVLPITAYAPPGCILNALPPAPTLGRHIPGSYIPALIFGALAEVVPEQVMADVGMGTTFVVSGRHADGGELIGHYFSAGGLGALRGHDGRQTAPFPVNGSGIASEVWELETGVTVLRHELLPDSGGAGEFRGGAGQVSELRNDSGGPLKVVLFCVRTEYPPFGIDGGGSGRRRRVLIDGVQVPSKGAQVLAPGSILTIEEAGGGGVGNSLARPPEVVLRDVEQGFVTPAGALRDYGVEVDMTHGRAVRNARRRVGA